MENKNQSTVKTRKHESSLAKISDYGPPVKHKHFLGQIKDLTRKEKSSKLV